MEKLRTFIAIELPPDVKKEIASIQGRLKTAGHTFVKWVDPQSIHLTLKFLGDISPDIVTSLTEAVGKASAETSAFSLDISRLGVFPGFARPRVAWVGVSGEVKKLGQLQKRIDSALLPLGFKTETRSFNAHLTLARLRDWASPLDRQSFGGMIEATRYESGSSFEVDAISLMKSTLTPGGAIYNCLARVKLKASCQLQ